MCFVTTENHTWTLNMNKFNVCLNNTLVTQLVLECKLVKFTARFTEINLLTKPVKFTGKTVK